MLRLKRKTPRPGVAVRMLVLTATAMAIAASAKASRAGERKAPVAFDAALKGAGPVSGLHPAKGRLLVASPSLLDPTFAETVVLLLEAGPEGAVGVILNRRTDIALSTALRDIPELRGRNDRLHLGGPVDPFRVLLLVRSTGKPEDSLQILEDVFITGSVDALKQLLQRKKAKAELRVFAGFAAWGGGQLDAEIQRGDWVVGAGDAAAVFSRQPESLWKTLHERFAGQWVRRATPPALRHAV